MWASFRSAEHLFRLLPRMGPPISRRPTLSPSVLVAEAVETATDSGYRIDRGQTEMLDRIAALPELPNGLYLHGDVGRGKTWLADLVFDQFPEPKRRLHCHELLAEINGAIARRVRGFSGQQHAGSGAGMTAVAKAQRGTEEPLFRDSGSPSAAEHIASVVEGCRFIMIDDFHVHDVADGRLASVILETLRKQETFMLLTSNYAPAELLPNPLFHETFQSAITLIEQRCEVIEIGAGRDHRRYVKHEGGFGSGTWSVSPRQEGAPEPGRLPPDGGSRLLSVTFAELCERPYSVADYFTLVNGLDCLLLREVPVPEGIGEEPFQRFAFLIDALAASDVRLDIEAAVALKAFGRTPNLPRDSPRLLSRLALLNTLKEQDTDLPHDRKGHDCP